MGQFDEKEVALIKQQAIEEYEKSQFALEFAKLVNSQATGLRADRRVSDSLISVTGKYDRDQIITYLASPQNYETQLRELSRYLENTSVMYKRIVNYLPSISIDCPVIFPTQVDKFETKVEDIKKNYAKAVIYLELLNIQHEFIKVRRTVFREDVFYGIEYEDEKNNSYYIKQLNPDYCRISSVQDACYNFEFDFAFFDKDDDEETLLNTYETIVPGFFRTGYTKYKGDSDYQWQELPAEKSICIKLQEDLAYCFPYYVASALDVVDIQDYKNLEKVSTEQNNYRLLAFEIPRMGNNNGKPDSFEVKATTALQFFNMARQNIDDSIGAFVTPMPVKDISFRDANNNKNKVKDAVQNFYDTIGVTDMLFNGGENSTSTKYSIKTDEAVLFQLNRSLERWLNRKFKAKFKDKFKVKLLDVTSYNKEEVIAQLTQGATLGLPVKMKMASVVGQSSPLETAGLTFLENEILGLHEQWVPLSTSYTQSGDEPIADEGGRPEVDDADLSETGESTRENDSNDRG